MSKRVQNNVSKVPAGRDELERLLDALIYIVSQRQMRRRWGPTRVGSHSRA
jgi:hypothetical protein